MLDSVPVSLAAGVVLGALAGMGVGGGSLLILWLTLVLGMEHSAARTVNLLFFLPSAVISSLFRWKQGTLQYRKVIPAVLAGTTAAALFSLLSRQVDVSQVRKLFGLLLLVTGARELFYRPRKAK